MDRIETYVGQTILEWCFSKPDQNKMVALGKVISAMFGSTTFVNGLACTAPSTAGLTVSVAPGEIYQSAALEATVCGTLPADTTHLIMKQGIALDAVTLPNSSSGVTSLAAPTTAGQSVNYLIEAAYADADVSIDPTTGSTPVVLPFFNSSNATTPYQGPNGSGVSSNTFRKGTVALQVRAGNAATTGTQVTPAPDAGYVGLWVVTVAYGQTTITSANITQYAAAPILPSSLLASIQSGNLLYGSDVSSTANVVQGSFPLPPTSLVDNQRFWVKIKNANTGATTFTPNSGVVSASPVVGAAHSALQGNELVANGRALLIWRADIASYVLESCTGGAQQVSNASASQHAVTAVQVANGSIGTAIAGGSANAITASFPMAGTAYVSGQPFLIVSSTTNTGAMTAILTLGGIAQTSISIVKGNNIALGVGDFPTGYTGEFNYSPSFGALVMQNPATGVAASGGSVGDLILFSGATVPANRLLVPTAATNISRTTYSKLFAVLTTSTTATWTSGATSLTVASMSNIAVGYAIGGVGIPVGATVTAISGTTVTISAATTAAGVATTITIAPWGLGDGSTTFGMPYCPADYTFVQANSNIGSSTVGQVISHSHTITSMGTILLLTGNGTNAWYVVGTNSTSATGGAANLAAGIRSQWTIVYQ